MPRFSLRPGDFVVLAVLVFAGLVGIDLARSGLARPFGYASSDAYYYLTIARHVVHDGRFAFDGAHTTNGFHPVWQLLLVPVWWVTERAGGAPHHVLAIALALQVFLIAGALFWMGTALEREQGTPTFLYVL